ncbi:MAG: iron export ABC transporter permease subunit FetB [Pleurocapsa sp. MO_226.B13]|nr:iron export ABC transporter permease subunit FetB [Pleurocapsa sp. MO_226.B13]
MNDLISLDTVDLVLCLGMIGIAIALSLWQKLGLEKQLAYGAVRSLMQLIAIGYILDIVFALDNWWSVLAILGIMITIASIVTRNRIDKKLEKLLPTVVLSLVASSAFTLGYVILLIIQPKQWYEPQYLIPLAGMLFGNAMNSASLAGDRLLSSINQNRLEIETHLCLGATPQQAIASYKKEAIRTGLIPVLNNMVVMGLVSLPGMFTGQVLAGSEPLDAASYQILILFAIVLTNAISAVLVTQGIYRQFFNQDEQLIS